MTRRVGIVADQTHFSAPIQGKIWADERPDRANESGLSDPSASLDYTEERPG